MQTSCMILCHLSDPRMSPFLLLVIRKMTAASDDPADFVCLRCCCFCFSAYVLIRFSSHARVEGQSPLSLKHLIALALLAGGDRKRQK